MVRTSRTGTAMWRLLKWAGKGRYDPRFNLDGKNGPQVIPPAYGLKSMHRVTSTGDGTDLAYWNRYVAVTQMGGQGTIRPALQPRWKEWPAGHPARLRAEVHAPRHVHRRWYGPRVLEPLCGGYSNGRARDDTTRASTSMERMARRSSRPLTG